MRSCLAASQVVGKEEFLAVQKHKPTMHFVQVASALWMVPTKDGSETPDYINHSCNPNCGMLVGTSTEYWHVTMNMQMHGSSDALLMRTRRRLMAR